MVEAVFEQNGSRITDFRRGERLGKRDHRVYWPRPKRPYWMSPEEYADFPEQLCVRELQVGGRVLVTTILNSRTVCKRTNPASLPHLHQCLTFTRSPRWR